VLQGAALAVGSAKGGGDSLHPMACGATSRHALATALGAVPQCKKSTKDMIQYIHIIYIYYIIIYNIILI
jgi:hypothetical protein